MFTTFQVLQVKFGLKHARELLKSQNRVGERMEKHRVFGKGFQK